MERAGGGNTARQCMWCLDRRERDVGCLSERDGIGAEQRLRRSDAIEARANGGTLSCIGPAACPTPPYQRRERVEKWEGAGAGRAGGGGAARCGCLRGVEGVVGHSRRINSQGFLMLPAVDSMLPIFPSSFCILATLYNILTTRLFPRSANRSQRRAACRAPRRRCSARASCLTRTPQARICTSTTACCATATFRPSTRTLGAFMRGGWITRILVRIVPAQTRMTLTD